MYIFDTNLLSEIMRETPDPTVAIWLQACPIETMFTTTICQTEILYGVRRLPPGQRRDRLIAAARAMFETTFAGRILAFDATAAAACADIRIARDRAGRPITTEDGMIAAIGRIAGAAIVTRDEGGFTGCGVPVINPWLAP